MKEQGQGLGLGLGLGYTSSGSGMNSFRGGMTGGHESFLGGSPTNNTTNITGTGANGTSAGGGSTMMTSEKDRERDSVRQIVTQLRQVIYLKTALSCPISTHPTLL